MVAANCLLNTMIILLRNHHAKALLQPIRLAQFRYREGTGRLWLLLALLKSLNDPDVIRQFSNYTVNWYTLQYRRTGL